MIGWTIAGVCMFLALIIMKKCYNNENAKIFSNPNYAIGEILLYERGKSAIMIPKLANSPPSGPRVRYKFIIDGIEFIQNYDILLYDIPDSGPTEGEKYLVIYLKSNPKESRMLFNYPIKGKADFQKYLEEFKTNPPRFKERR